MCRAAQLSRIADRNRGDVPTATKDTEETRDQRSSENEMECSRRLQIHATNKYVVWLSDIASESNHLLVRTKPLAREREHGQVLELRRGLSHPHP